MRLARVSDPQLSPDGRLVAYALRETDMAGDRGIGGLWLVPANGGAQPVRLTEKVSNASSPRWAPDGRELYFLSDRAGSLQVWKLPLAGGEARQVTDYPLPVGVFAVAPRGDQLLVGLSVFLDCEDLECTRRRLDDRSQAKASGVLYPP